MSDLELMMRDKKVAKAIDCGVSTVWLLVKQGHLPAPVKIGGSTRWFRKDIEAFLEAKRKRADQLHTRA